MTITTEGPRTVSSTMVEDIEKVLTLGRSLAAKS